MTGFTMRRKALAARVEAGAANAGQSLARLLAIAHAVERLVQAGTLPSYRDAARRLGISHVRMSEIGALATLAPDMQEAILLELHSTTERRIRVVTDSLCWLTQRATMPIGEPTSS